MNASDIKTSHPRDTWFGIEDNTVSSRSDDVSCLPSRSAADGLAIQPVDAGGIARRAEGGGCRVKYMDLCDVARAWAVGKGGGAIECRVLIIKEKESDQVIEVDLTDMFPECPK